MLVKTKYGKGRITLATIVCKKPRFYVHLMRAAPEPTPVLPSRTDARLTPRQLQVLRLLDAGLAAKEISSRLGVEVATVRNHIRAVLRGLHAHSQLDALARARREGLLRR